MKASKYKLAIFDFDGTLADSVPGIKQVIRQVINECNLPDNIHDQWLNLFGMALLKQLQVLFPNESDSYHQNLINHYRSIHSGRTIQLCPPFPHVQNVLKELNESGIQICIASSKRRDSILEVLEHHNLTNYFKLIIGREEVTNEKPHPESVNHITNVLQISPDKTVVIGDSSYDLEMAQRACVSSIGITTGIHTKEILCKYAPLKIVTSLMDVLPVILNGHHQQTNLH